MCFSDYDHEHKKAKIWSVDGKLQQTLSICLPEYAYIESMRWNKRDTSIAICQSNGILVIWDLGTDCITGRTDIGRASNYCWKDEDTLVIFTVERKAGDWTYSIYSRMANDTSDDLFKSPPVMVFSPNEWSNVLPDLFVST